MTTKQEIREYIRKVLAESINNFIDIEEGTETKQLNDTSKSQSLGDPIDIELNQMADELGSDGDNAPTVSVIAGAVKGGNGYNTGQHQANFSDKTKKV